MSSKQFFIFYNSKITAPYYIDIIKLSMYWERYRVKILWNWVHNRSGYCDRYRARRIQCERQTDIPKSQIHTLNIYIYTSDDCGFIAKIDMEIRSATSRESFGEKRASLGGIELKAFRRIGDPNDPILEFQEPMDQRSADESSSTYHHAGSQLMIMVISYHHFSLSSLGINKVRERESCLGGEQMFLMLLIAERKMLSWRRKQEKLWFGSGDTGEAWAPESSRSVLVDHLYKVIPHFATSFSYFFI